MAGSLASDTEDHSKARGGGCIKPSSSSVFWFLPLAQTNLKPVARGVCTMETIEVMLQAQSRAAEGEGQMGREERERPAQRVPMLYFFETQDTCL